MSSDLMHTDWASLVEILTDITDQRVGLTDGCERVVRFRSLLGQMDNELFLPFVGVDSDLHVFPTGPSREHWSAEALAREDAKRIGVEDHYRPMVLIAAHKLLSFAQQRLLTIGSSDRGARLR